MKNNVYIIRGSKGLCPEDHEEWFVCTYLDKNSAITYMTKLNEDLKIHKEINKNNMDKCNEIDEDEFCNNNCDECQYSFDYNLNEQHLYKIVECELRL